MIGAGGVGNEFQIPLADGAEKLVKNEPFRVPVILPGWEVKEPTFNPKQPYTDLGMENRHRAEVTLGNTRLVNYSGLGGMATAMVGLPMVDKDQGALGLPHQQFRQAAYVVSGKEERFSVPTYNAFVTSALSLQCSETVFTKLASMFYMNREVQWNIGEVDTMSVKSARHCTRSDCPFDPLQDKTQDAAKLHSPGNMGPCACFCVEHERGGPILVTQFVCIKIYECVTKLGAESTLSDPNTPFVNPNKRSLNPVMFQESPNGDRNWPPRPGSVYNSAPRKVVPLFANPPSAEVSDQFLVYTHRNFHLDYAVSTNECRLYATAKFREKKVVDPVFNRALDQSQVDVQTYAGAHPMATPSQTDQRSHWRSVPRKLGAGKRIADVAKVMLADFTKEGRALTANRILKAKVVCPACSMQVEMVEFSAHCVQTHPDQDYLLTCMDVLGSNVRSSQTLILEIVSITARATEQAERSRRETLNGFAKELEDRMTTTQEQESKIVSIQKKLDQKNAEILRAKLRQNELEALIETLDPAKVERERQAAQVENGILTNRITALESRLRKLMAENKPAPVEKQPTPKPQRSKKRNSSAKGSAETRVKLFHMAPQSDRVEKKSQPTEPVEKKSQPTEDYGISNLFNQAGDQAPAEPQAQLPDELAPDPDEQQPGQSDPLDPAILDQDEDMV